MIIMVRKKGMIRILLITAAAVLFAAAVLQVSMQPETRL